MNWNRTILIAISVLLAIRQPLMGQNFGGGFNFYLPPNDTTDQRFWPRFPKKAIGSNDFVSVSPDGHFAVNGKAIRFFGTNLVADGAFPPKEKAGFIAGRLRKMGFNLIRFHHMDNPWSSGSLFEQGKDTRHLNPITLDRFEYLIAQLKRNGIYANINLHVSRTFRQSDGVPDADSIRNFGKGVTYFDPHLIELQKEYAKQLLLHVNPYTGLPLARDPAMAMVEITNENSLFQFWRDNKLKHFSLGGDLTIRHSRMLDSLWLDFLRQKYGTTTALQRVWNVGARVYTGENQISGGDFDSDPLMTNWQLELHNPANGTRAIDVNNPFDGLLSARVTITNSDGVDWHAQWKYIGISLEKDSLYTVRFAARADQIRTITVSVMRDVNPWDSFFSTTFQVSTHWQLFQFSFRAKESVNRVVRLSFHVGDQSGSLWFDDVYLGPGVISGLLPEESLEQGNVRRLDYFEANSFTDARVKDMSEFYLELQQNYFKEMKDYLTQELGVQVPIVGTNSNVGPPDLAAQSQLDYMDVHAYWDHPQFPNEPWSPTDWLINNTPMVMDPYGGTVPGMFAGVGMVGKPLTISEYNHPFPNRFQTEGVLFLTGYAAFHGADALEFFDYNSGASNWETDKVDSYFSLHRNTAMMALMPSCAMAFRQNWIRAAEETVELSYSNDQILLAPKYDDMDWRGIYWFSPLLSMENAVRTVSFEDLSGLNPEELPPEPMAPFRTDTEELEWNPSGIFKVVTPMFVAATGFLDRFANLQLGQHQLVSASGFGTFTWVALTGDSLSTAGLSLISLSSRIQNSGMVWDGNHTIHNNWGRPPTQLEPIRIKLNLYIEADSLKVHSLSPIGAETDISQTYYPVAANRFEIELDQQKAMTIWFGLEASGSGLSSVPQKGKLHPEQFQLYQNRPNPFSVGVATGTFIAFRLPREAAVTLSVYDILGRRVWAKKAAKLPAGDHGWFWHGKDASGEPVAAGVYLYRVDVQFRDSAISKVGKMILVN